MEYKLVPYEQKYFQSFVSLLQISFKVQLSIVQQLIRWKYFDSFFKNKSISFIALDSEQNVVSQYTNIPIPVSKNDTVYKSMVCIDMTTHPSHRGQGLISLLSKKVYEEVQKQKYDFTIGFSNNDGIKVDKNSRGYGYKIIGKFVSYYKFIIYKKKSKFHLVKLDVFEEIPIHSGLYALTASKEYLNWRYKRKPDHNYESCLVLDDKSKQIGVVIFRKKYGRLYVLKIYALSMRKNIFDEILKAIENYALHRGERLIIYSVLSNSFWESLFGNYHYLKKTKSNINYYLTIKIHNPKKNTEELCNKENWFVMNGDII